MSNLDIELGRWLFQQRPRLLECADDETAEALNALAAMMGCLLVTVKARSGETDFRQALRALIARVEKTADVTSKAALGKKRQGSRTPH